MSRSNPRIWVLLGERVGDNNQLLALAEELGVPFETRTLQYRRFWPLLLRLFPRGAQLLAWQSRATLQPPWPDLVIGIGRRSVPVARWIKRRSGSRARLVRLGNPRAATRLFDLVVTTAQYPVTLGENVLLLPVAMGRNRNAEADAGEAGWLAALPRPHLLFALGGSTRYWRFPIATMADAAARVAARAEAAGGSLIVATSPRTPAEAVSAIREAVPAASVVDRQVRFPVLLSDADQIFVTADSVSMMSEAVLAGKPMGLVPVELDEEGRGALGEEPGSSALRDIRRFQQELRARGLAGTIDEPLRGDVVNPVEIAADAVRRLLGDRVE